MLNGGIEYHIIHALERSIKSVLSGINSHSLPPHGVKATLDIPKEKTHGELTSNIAFRLAGKAGLEPFAFAKMVRDDFAAALSHSRLKEVVDRVEAKEPGFINFFLTKSCLCKVLLEIKRKRDRFGKSGIGRGIKLQVEFVSANPTGPLTIAHGRQAAVGDSLASILQFTGHDVTREYYLNDEGTQMDILGRSIRARYLELLGVKVDFPEDGYKGTYVADIAKDFKRKYGKRFANAGEIGPFREFGLNWILKDIKRDLKDFGVRFNIWYSQRGLRRSGRIEKTLRFLKKKGFIYEKDQAVWFKSQSLGDDKDRVIIKSDGSYTYLAPDIAYHLDKYKRGFKRIVDMWGPDHHGYIPRMKAAVKALGYPPDSLVILIAQLATLYRDGQVVSMSTRAGEFVTLREVMDEVGKDVARFCFMMRRLSSHLDFDLSLVKKESQENPVYYIQYAHARIWSILEHAKKVRVSTKFDSGLFKEEEEFELMRLLRLFPKVVISSANSYEPYIILQYLQDLATVFHSFYTKHKVVGDDPNLSRARIVLVDCVRIVLANGLRLLGVSFPKKM